MEKVNPELLQKYFSGLCSDEEEAMVVHWLMFGARDEPAAMSGERRESLRKGLWSGISRRTGIGEPAPRKTLYRPLYRYATAACLLLVCCGAVCFIILRGNAPGEIIVNNTSDNFIRKVDAYGMHIQLPPKAEAAIKAGDGATEHHIRFCGDMKVKTERAMDALISSSCGTRTHRPLQRHLAKGKTYAFIHMYPNADDVLVVENDFHSIDMLPPSLRYKVDCLLDI